MWDFDSPQALMLIAAQCEGLPFNADGMNAALGVIQRLIDAGEIAPSPLTWDGMFK